MITKNLPNIKFTLVIPAHNEAPVIAPTLALLRDTFDRAQNIDGTIIVVENASTDGTGDAVLGLADERVQLLRREEQAKGNAVRAAFAEAKEGYVGFTDADLAVSPKEIVAAVQLLAENTVDIIIGSRLLPQSQTPGREWWRGASSRIFNFLARVIVGVKASDTQCPLKVMNMKVVKVMLATREPTWFFDLEFLAFAERLNLRIKEIPITWNEHRYPERKSKLSSVDGARAVAAMFRIRRRLSTQVALLEQMMLNEKT